MKLYIKYMVSLRCKMKVEEELRILGIKFLHVDLGNVITQEKITAIQRQMLKENLLDPD